MERPCHALLRSLRYTRTRSPTTIAYHHSRPNLQTRDILHDFTVYQKHTMLTDTNTSVQFTALSLSGMHSATTGGLGPALMERGQANMEGGRANRASPQPCCLRPQHATPRNCPSLPALPSTLVVRWSRPVWSSSGCGGCRGQVWARTHSVF